jgi:hypothetical protein
MSFIKTATLSSDLTAGSSSSPVISDTDRDEQGPFNLLMVSNEDTVTYKVTLDSAADRYFLVESNEIVIWAISTFSNFHISNADGSSSGTGASLTLTYGKTDILLNILQRSSSKTTVTATCTGAAADGSAKSGYPVLVAGEDGTNAQTFKTNSSGHQMTDYGSTIETGQQTVGNGAAVQVTSTSTAGVLTVKADDDNANEIYVGLSGVTTSGFRLKAGQAICMKLVNASLIYCISDAAAQTIHYCLVKE